jgi:hypothetical protein
MHGVASAEALGKALFMSANVPTTYGTAMEVPDMATYVSVSLPLPLPGPM